MKKNKTRDDLYMEDVPQNTKATVRRLLSRLGRQKGRLLVVTTATLLSSAAYAAIPLLVGMALDNLLAVLRGGASAEQKLSLAAGRFSCRCCSCWRPRRPALCSPMCSSMSSPASGRS